MTKPTGKPRGRPRTVTPAVASAAELAWLKAGKGRRTPLEIAEFVYNDPDADVNRRDRLTIAAMPYKHARQDVSQPEGKKAQAIADAQNPDRQTALGALMALRMSATAAN